MSKIFVARQSIYNLNGKIFGYELFFRDDEGGMKYFPSDLSATARVLLNVTNHMNLDKIKKSKENYLFINVNHDVITSGILDTLDPKHFVIELLETTEINDQIIAHIVKLKKRGFKIALDDFDCSNEMIVRYGKILKLFDIIKFDVHLVIDGRLKKLVRKLKENGITLLAEKVETKEQYQQFSRLGFDLYQGYYFEKPENIEGDMNYHTMPHDILKLVQMLKDDEETTAIEHFFRSRPDMSYNLIKFLNSHDSAMKNEIYSIEHAIALLGRNKLIKWLLMHLYSEHAAKELPKGIVETAIARAEKMETVVSGTHNKMAYLAGMYSMLDVLFDREMAELMQDLQIDVSIKKAILHGHGELGKSLTAVKEEESHSLRQVLIENIDKFSDREIIAFLEKGDLFNRQ